MLEVKDIQTLQEMIDKQSERLEMRFMTVFESDIRPKLQMLAEGQKTILDKVVPASRIEALEEEIVVLRGAVKYLSEKVSALEKAQ